MSLERLILKDFVIVRALELGFAQGFTVLTGETGAGKSILIDALQLVLGARADSGLIREGCKRCEVSAEFGVTPPILSWLEQAGLLPESSADSDVFAVETAPVDTLLLRRQIDREGKSRAWINGVAVSATQLRELGDYLVDIHGQHAWQSLIRPKAVCAVLDAFAGVDSIEVGQLFAQWQEALAQWEKVQSKAQTMALERERLQWQVSELEKLKPQEQEWLQLGLEQQRLSHAQALLNSAQNSLLALELENEAQQNAYTLLHQAQRSLEEQVEIEPQFQPLIESLNSALTEVDECRRVLHQYLDRTEVDEVRLQYVDARMTLWLGLARRLHQTPERLPEYWFESQEQLQALDELSDSEALQKNVQEAEKAYRSAAQKLTQQRQQAAQVLGQKITLSMQTLGMEGGQFAVEMTADTPSKTGMDTVQFLVAGHAGSIPKPLVKVASGGELSRLALAIAVTTSGLGQVPTLIFDEIDSGVGGTVASTVGRLMQTLGCERQVLAVTHLPQVAASANQHFCVRKEQDANGVFSAIAILQGEGRVLEIARMLGGSESSSASLTHAREMLYA